MKNVAITPLTAPVLLTRDENYIIDGIVNKFKIYNIVTSNHAASHTQK